MIKWGRSNLYGLLILTFSWTVIIRPVHGQFNGLECTKDTWQYQMPFLKETFDKKSEKNSKISKLKLYGGQNASKKKFNWVVQISEIGYKQGMYFCYVIRYYVIVKKYRYYFLRRLDKDR